MVPTVMLTIESQDGRRSFFAFDVRGEVIETVETDIDGYPDWTYGGVCDPRGSGSVEGFRALRESLAFAEQNAESIGLQVVRLDMAGY